MKKKLHFLFIATFAVILPLCSHAQTIATIAGVGTEGYTGDHGSPLSASFNWPASVAIDKAGNIYIADADNNVIRKISNNVITTVAGDGFRAGTGYGDFTGDGAAATAARLFSPTGVAVDTSGNLFIADNGNNCIRKVDTGGIITTIAGTGGAGNGGYTGDGGSPATAQLRNPARVAVDTNGNVFIADAGNSAIREIALATGNISTIAGTGITGFGGDGGAANMAQLNMANDIAVDDSGYIYIADTYNNVIRKIDLTGNISSIAGTTIAGFSGDGGPATDAYLFQPAGIAVDDSGIVYFSDLGNHRVRMVSRAGIITTMAGTDTAGFNGDGRLAATAELSYPEGLAVRPNKNVYIADRGNFRVRVINTSLAANNVKTTGGSISLFPNPNEGTFTVSIITNFEEQAQVTVTNVTGEKISEATTRTNAPLSVKLDAPPGIYFLSAVTVHGVLNEKLVIQ